MAVLRRQFHHHERNMGNEDWHYLARDTETDRFFIIHAWSHRNRQGHFESAEVEMSIGEFLAGRDDTARRNLIALLGSLVSEG